MRHRTTLPCALILVLAAIVSTAPALLAKQDPEVQQDLESSFAEDITITTSDDPGEQGDQLQAFDVTFAAHAYIPERTYPESMVVKVQSGAFAFRVQSEVLVDPEGDSIPVLTADPPIDLGANPNAIFVDDDPNNDERIFTEAGTVQNCSGTAPNTLCLLDPDVLGENFVQLVAGDLVYLPDNSTCFFCNTAELDAEAELLVWAPATGFSWHQLYEAQLSTRSDSTIALNPGLRETRGWMFNPGSRCN